MIRVCWISRTCIVGIVLLGWLGVGPMCSAHSSTFTHNAGDCADVYGPINCGALAEITQEPHWLSLPMSRLVVNPFTDEYMGHPGESASTEGDLVPINIAYYVGAAPVPLPALWFVQSLAGITEPSRLILGNQLSVSSLAGWNTNGVTVRSSNGGLTVTSLADYGSISQTVTVDLDKCPDLLVQTANRGNFDMKVNDGSQSVDILLTPRQELGANVCSVPTATGWHGVKTFRVILYALGRASPVTFTHVQFVGGNRKVHYTTVNNWDPSRLITSVYITPTKILLQSTTILPNVDTVSQHLHFDSPPSWFVISGRFGGRVRWNSEHNVLHLMGNGFNSVLTASAPLRWLGVRPTDLDWALPHERSKNSDFGVWRAAVKMPNGKKDLIVTMHFQPSSISDTKTPLLAPVSATPKSFSSSLNQRIKYWNALLCRVPRPLDFTIDAVKSLSVSSAEVCRNYYRAWAFFFTDTLPPMPENHYPFAQICTGKPSMWTDGAPHSPESAVWDGAVASQALALVQPGLCWNAIEGMLSQVDQNGYMPGEVLPTVYAQSVWLLFQRTHDLEQLRRVYPSLKRYIDWRIAHPHWVWPNKSIADLKPDSDKSNEFVVHEIVDMGFASKIANALNLSSEVKYWDDQKKTAIAEYQVWFWPAPGNVVWEDYYGGTSRSGSEIDWTLKGLGINPTLLPSADKNHLVDLFSRSFNASTAFGIRQNRFGDLEPITLGLFRHGQIDDSRKMSDIIMRDVTRAHGFSEDYSRANPPVPSGVRPSSFGARLMTDSVLWHNGVVLDEGLPILLGMPGAAGVNDVPVMDKTLSIRYDQLAHTASLSGPALAILQIPVGFRKRRIGPKVIWIGSILFGQEIHLETHHNL